MKALLLLLTLLLSFAAKAQSGDSLLYYIQHRYNTIDQQYLPTQYLYDRTLPMSSIAFFDGIHDTTITKENWQQMYLEMYNSSFSPDFPNVDSLNWNNIPSGVSPFPASFLPYLCITIREGNPL